MLLKKVEYRLFEYEVGLIDQTGDDPHELDRELCLIASDNQHTFVSWQQNRDGNYIEYGNRSFFKSEGVSVDASAHDFWQGLIGKSISFGYWNDNKQILGLSCGDDKVFVCAYEMDRQRERGYWGADTLFICRQPPSR